MKHTHLAGKNLLFAELIIVILFFSLAAAGCILLFAEAYRDNTRSCDLSNAVIIAQNIAECFKATGDINETVNMLGYADGNNVYGNLWVYAESVMNVDDNVYEVHIVIRNDYRVVFEMISAVPKGVVS
jgi:hypothetical protein